MLIACLIVLLDKEGTCNSEQVPMYLEGLTQVEKLEVLAGETGKVGPHVGIAGPKSMLDSREIGDLRGGGVLI